MNTEKFSQAMGELDSRYIQEAILYKQDLQKRRHSWTRWGSLAACLCLVLGAVFAFPRFSESSGVGDPLSHSGPSVSSPASQDVTKQEDPAILLDETMTLEEALLSQPFGSHLLSNAPSGFIPESIRRYQNEHANYLLGLWTTGEGSFDEIRWQVSFFDETMENRLISVDDTASYDLGLYFFPLADSVPEELFEVVDNPIFSIDELTLEAVNRRAYSVYEDNDTNEIRMSFGVRCDELVIEVTTKGVAPEWLYEQLIRIGRDGL